MESFKLYILVDRKPVELKGNRMKILMQWWEFFDKDENRRVAFMDLGNGVTVSTVFLGIDHAFGDRKPLLFETMIFGGVNDGYQTRYATWIGAEAGHKKAVKFCLENELIKN